MPTEVAFLSPSLLAKRNEECVSFNPNSLEVSAFVNNERITLPCVIPIQSNNFDIHLDILIHKVGELEVLGRKTFQLKAILKNICNTTNQFCTEIMMHQTLDIFRVCFTIQIKRKLRKEFALILHYKKRVTSIVEMVPKLKPYIPLVCIPPILAICSSVPIVLVSSPFWIPVLAIIAVLGSPIWISIAALAFVGFITSFTTGMCTYIIVQSKQFQNFIKEISLSTMGGHILYENNDCTDNTLYGEMFSYIERSPSNKLVASLVLDFFGNCSFCLPGLGEGADVLWAPISSYMLAKMYEDSSPSACYAGFLEEILPFTDVIPTATLSWAKEYYLFHDDKKKIERNSRTL